MALIPNPMDATSFYRGMGPLTQLMHQGNLWVNEQEANINWATLSKYDAFFMQRPFTDNHVAAAKMAYDNGVPLWVDYDDDLFNVPTDNPAFPVYGSPQIQKNVATIIAMANQVTVSTSHLAERYSPMNMNVRTVPNAYDERLQKWRPIPNKKKDKLVLWRGSNTHHKDLVSVGAEVIALSHEHLDITWQFIGWNPWFLTDQMPHKNVICAGAMDMTDYIRYIATIKPGIAYVPLFPSMFNKSKSNIAWIEATFAGAAVLGPHLDEWRKPGMHTYSTQDDFKDKLKGMFTGAVDLAGMNEESWQYIMDCLTLARVNEARIDVLQKLTGKSFK